MAVIFRVTALRNHIQSYGMQAKSGLNAGFYLGSENRMTMMCGHFAKC